MKSPSAGSDLPIRVQMRNFARLILPIFEAEYQSQLMAPQPSWMFLTVLEREIRRLEKQAR